MQKIDLSVRRRMYWQDEVEGEGRCPDCEGELVSQDMPFAVFVRLEEEPEMMILELTGHFCTACPVVVLDQDVVEAMVADALPESVEQFEFFMGGVVDLAAVPKPMRDKPLGEKDNPLPLVLFLPHDGDEC